MMDTMMQESLEEASVMVGKLSMLDKARILHNTAMLPSLALLKGDEKITRLTGLLFQLAYVVGGQADELGMGGLTAKMDDELKGAVRSGPTSLWAKVMSDFLDYYITTEEFVQRNTKHHELTKAFVALGYYWSSQDEE